MMKEALPRLLPLVVILGMVLSLLGCSGNSASEHPATGGAQAAETKQATGASASADQHQIVIDNFTFKPATLTVPVGTKVTWVNHDDVPHTATSTANPPVFNSRTLDSDEQFSFVFTTPGTYEYFCAVHPKMTGRITVQ
jgi:plastocyanin